MCLSSSSSSSKSNARILFSIAIAIILLSVRYVALDLTLPKYTVHKDIDEGIILITGTSTGIGRATCLDLSSRYPKITFFCTVRKEKDGENLQRSSNNNNVQPIILDVTNVKDIESVIDEISRSAKPLIGVVQNAGVSLTPVKTVEYLSFEEYKFHYDVNTFGVFRLTQAVLPLLRQTKGRLVLMSSISGRVGFERTSAYGGSKHAVEALGDVLRKEVGPLGVAVSIIEPGALPSAITERVLRLEREKFKCLEENEAECNTYPHLYNEEKLMRIKDFVSNMGDLNETVRAIEDAMFASQPKPRYVTSVLGPIPAWFFIRLADFLPDHLFDML